LFSWEAGNSLDLRTFIQQFVLEHGGDALKDELKGGGSSLGEVLLQYLKVAIGLK
jgi:hypothetical protein